MNQLPLSFDVVSVFGLAFVVTLGLILLFRFLPFLQQVKVREEKGRMMWLVHYFRLGGLSLFGGFITAFWFDERLVLDFPLQILILGGVLSLLLGLLDDRRPLHWTVQLAGQIFLGFLLFFSGMNIGSIHLGGGELLDFSSLPIPGVSLLVTVFWVGLVMNAINWADGVDGLMGGVMAIALTTIFILSLRPEVNQPAMALLTAMLLGAVLAFLVLNWFPAKIIAGSNGAAFLGFMLAALSVYAGTKVATALLVLVVPILDLCVVIVVRIIQGRSPFLPDHEHLHHLLLGLGWSARQVASLYIGITAFMAWIALSVRLLEKLLVLSVIMVVFIGIAWWARKARIRQEQLGAGV